MRDLGKLNDAKAFTLRAIELNPNSALAHSNLGSVLRDLGKLNDAKAFTLRAIKLNPSFVKAHFNLGFILTDLGKYQDAFDSYQKVIEINPKFSNIYTSIIEFLNNSDLTQLNKLDLKKILTILLEKNDISHKNLFNVFRFLYNNEMITNLDGLDLDIIKNQCIFNEVLLIEALKKIIFVDLKLEAQLIKIRKKICDFIAKNETNFNYSSLEFLIALGEQCFLNEYIYSISEEEKISLNTIINKCIIGELNETNIAILSCYYPLYKLIDKLPLLKSKTSTNSSFKKLIELQIKEPLKEIELSNQVKRLGKIDNDISLRVKSQYEVNPYPRWRHGNHLQNNNLSVIQGINNEIKPNYVSRYLDNDKLKILIAGCGTGYHILQAKKYKNAQITAIDLSLSSLGYAQRKINELKIDNVELIQMDILEVSLLGTQFDIIECAGVLHHMDNPCRGLKALLDILKSDGFLQLGLYSELARKDIIKARKYIANKKIGANDNNIRNFRQQIVSGELNNFNSLKIFSDFYSLSELRDLCFHTCEHRFTISKLDEILQSYNLKFLGFSLPKIIKSNYEKYFPKDKEQTNLQNWEIFEEKYPNTFIEMYQFWVSKQSNGA